MGDSFVLEAFSEKKSYLFLEAFILSEAPLRSCTVTRFQLEVIVKLEKLMALAYRQGLELGTRHRQENLEFVENILGVSDGRYLFSQPAYAPTPHPEKSNLGVSLSDGRYLSHNLRVSTPHP